MALIAGIDSSTQSCKVVIRDADTGHLLRHGRAPHPQGTEVHPDAWWNALQHAITAAGGLDDVAAIAVAAQQHGMICLDEDGQVIRNALLWNDTRSATAADDLVEELGGTTPWANAVGSVPVASFTITKLRWLAEHEPHHATRTALLPSSSPPSSKPPSAASVSSKQPDPQNHCRPESVQPHRPATATIRRSTR